MHVSVDGCVWMRVRACPWIFACVCLYVCVCFVFHCLLGGRGSALTPFCVRCCCLAVLFIGVVVTPLCMVTEFCARGNLFDLLHDEATPLPWSLRKNMALDAAKGMSCTPLAVPVVC